MDATPTLAPEGLAERVIARLGQRSIVLVGMMGAGKTSIGKRLAAQLRLPFVDADAEIEKAANLSISEIFANYGETHFRDGERRVLARLLGGGPAVVATGGGAFMSEETRRRCKESSVTVWLNADVPVLLDRVRKKSNRPLLAGADPETTLRRLLAERAPTYAQADIVIASRDSPHAIMVGEIMAALSAYLDRGDAR
jgi:shikimate kinase